MSVLNQMLRELEHRGALPDVVAAAGTATVARPTLPAIRGRGDRMRLAVWLVAVAVAALLIGAYQWLGYRLEEASLAPATLGTRQFGSAANSGASAADAPTLPPASASPGAVSAVPASATLAPSSAALDVAASSPPGSGQSQRASADTAASSRAAAVPERNATSATAVTTQAATAIAQAPAAKAARSAKREAPARAEVAKASGSASSAPSTTALAAPASAASAAPTAQAPQEMAGAEGTPAPAIIVRAAHDVTRDLERANDLIARGRASEAIALLQTVLGREPGHPVARRTLAALLAEADRRGEALLVLLAGVEVDPAHFALAAAQMQAEAGDVQGAVRTLARVPEAQHTSAHDALAGGLLQRAGDHPAAIAAYRRALARPAPDPVWWVGLAVSLEARGELDTAQEAFTRAAAEPKLPAAVRAYVNERLAALSARGEQARRAALANVF